MIPNNPDFYPTPFDNFIGYNIDELKNHKQRTVRAIVCELKENGQDGEWYPTSSYILDIIKKSLGTDNNHESILDCGAGNGSALSALTKGKKYAIEKSEILIKEMPPDIFVVGCDFWENSLIDKKVDYVFCNPPYSEYKEWAIKIINESNIYAVTLWAIKNANSYFDSQLIDTFMSLVNKANLVNYKSNQKTWGGDRWRFGEELRDGKVSHFGLDYRCVLTLHGTFSVHGYDRYDYPNGISNRVHSLLNDLITVSNNLGFLSTDDSLQMEWEPGKENSFYMYDGDKHVILMSVRAYKNGNLHIKFNQRLLRKFNVEFGRLKGWLRSSKEASEELNIPEKEAKEYFKANFALECNYLKMLE